MINDEKFFENLNDNQKSVCLSPKNILLTACPGSGKTRTIIYRLAYLKKKNENSQLLDIAITYTNRAANEIEGRLEKMDIDISAIWTGTIHGFCMHFIIRPYAMYSKQLRRGYHVIDEFIKQEYCRKIASDLNISIGFKDPLSIPEIKEEYYKILKNNKEIDFDMILICAIELLEQNPFIAENIASLIRSIHVDEYQDTNEKQYTILKYIFQKNKDINLLFVGDVNQAIYRSLGGTAKKKSDLSAEFGIPFMSMCLDGCYRSTQRLVDYYTKFEIEKTGVKAVSPIRAEKGIIKYDSLIHRNDLPERIAAIIQDELDGGVSANEICVVAPQWNQILPMAGQLRKLLPDIPFDAPEISPFKYDRMNPFYLISQLVYSESGVHSRRRRRMVQDIIDIFYSEYHISKPEIFDGHDFLKIINSVLKEDEEGVLVFEKAVSELLKAFDTDLEKVPDLKKTYDEFLKKVQYRIENFSLPHTYSDLCHYFKEREGIVMTSIHGIKGEEYHTVIAFDLLNFHLPHNKYYFEEKVHRTNDTNKLLYVLCSRAKKNLYLFSERGRKTNRGYPLTPTDELKAVDFEYDN